MNNSISMYVYQETVPEKFSYSRCPCRHLGINMESKTAVTMEPMAELKAKPKLQKKPVKENSIKRWEKHFDRPTYCQWLSWKPNPNCKKKKPVKEPVKTSGRDTFGWFDKSTYCLRWWFKTTFLLKYYLTNLTQVY